MSKRSACECEARALVRPVLGALQPAGCSPVHPAPFLTSPATDLGSRVSAAEPSARLSLFVPRQPLSHRVAPGMGATEQLHSCAQELEDFGCAQTPGFWDSHIFVSPVLLVFEAKCGAVERGR